MMWLNFNLLKQRTDELFQRRGATLKEYCAYCDNKLEYIYIYSDSY